MAINLDVHGNTQPLEAAVQAAVNRIRKTPIKITVDDKGATQPLGNMKRGADEFSKSMEAANARIIAFGASMAIINGVSDAFKSLVKNVVEVEKALADINVVMGLSATNLDKFSSGLFKVAKETAASFDVAAAAATEYARQGLKVEETLKRTKDALILTRLTGMDSANAVKALTAAMNTYGDQIKDTTQLVSKFAAVDVQFAVSAEDFADAISRTGQAAKSAGVDIDELVGLVTAAQQQTARGGKVIGNSFKTIFTRIGRTDTLNQLENLGIAVRDVEGRTLGAKRILTDLANTFDHLSEAQKAQIAQTVGGVFQINVLKAVLSDAAKQNGILANATQISANATDEAIQKNEQLRDTMSAMASETGLALKEVSAQIGEIMLAPGMEKILNVVKSLTEGVGDMLGTGQGAGNTFAKGFLKGLGNIITGPGLVVMVAVFTKLLIKAFQYAKDSLKSLIGVTSEAQKQKAIQTSLVNLFGQNAALNKEMLRTDISRTEKEKILLGLLKAQVVEASTLNSLTKQMSVTLYSKGYGSNLTPRRGRAAGHIPNFANPERQQAAQGGYAAGTIRSMSMPGEGSVIYNSAETVKNFAGFKQPAIMPPKSSKAGQNYQQAFGSIHGFDPYAAGGYIPNFNRKQRGTMSKGRLNAGGKDFVLLTGDQSGRDGTKTWYVGTKNGIVKGYDSVNKAQKSTDRFSEIEVPYFGISTGDKAKIKSADIEEIDEQIRNTAINQAVAIGKELIGEKYQKEGNLRKQAEKTFNNGAFSAAAGSTFESAIGAMMEADMFQDYSSRTGTSLIDLPYSERVFSLFGASGKGKMGGEVKGSLNSELQKSAAEKFYKVLGLKQAAFQYKKTQVGIPSQSARGKFEEAGLVYDEKLQIPGQKKGTFAPGFRARAGGYIPNFANPLSDAIGREKAAGVPVSQIRVGSHGALMSKGNPLGLGVTNTQDEPNGLRDVFGAANGYVPNYFNPFTKTKDMFLSSNAWKQFEQGAKELDAEFVKVTKLIKEKQKLEKKHQSTINKLSGIQNRSQQQESQLIKARRDLTKTSNTLAKLQKNSSRLESSRNISQGSFLGRMSGGLGRRFSGNAGMMMMMGAPMAAGFLQGEGAGQTGTGGAMYAAGGALQGAASGAMMASMVAPFFGPAAPLVVGVGGLIGGLTGLMSSMDENTKALEEQKQQIAKTQTQSLVQGISSIAQPQELSRSLKSAGISGAAQYALRLEGDPSISDALKASAKMGLDVDPTLKEMITLGSNGVPKIGDAKYRSEKQVEQEIARRLAEVNKEIDFGTRGKGKIPKKELEGLRSLSDTQRYNMAVGRLGQEYKRSMEYHKLSKEFLGMDQSQEAPMPQFVSLMAPQVLEQRKQARSELVDFLMENEKKETFAFDFGGQTGTQYLKKDQYAKLLKGEKARLPDGTVAPAVDQNKASDALVQEIERIENEYKNKKAEQVQGLILQLNFQKAQIIAQQASADAQLNIKSKYLDIANGLNMQEKLMGGFISEQAKVQNKYLLAMNKARESYESGSRTAAETLKTGIIGDIDKSQSLEVALKQKLFKDIKEDSEAFEKIDLTYELAKMDAEKLLSILEELGETEEDARKIVENRNLLYEGAISSLQKQHSLSITQAANERQINLILADRKELLDDMNDRIEAFNKRSQFLSEKGALEKRISAAGRTGSGRYISRQQQLEIARSDMETYDIPALKRAGKGKKLDILKGSGLGFSGDEQAQIMAMRGNIDIASIVKTQKEAEFKNRGGKEKISSLSAILGFNQGLSDEDFKANIGGGKTSRQEMKAELSALKDLDEQRLGNNKELNKKVREINKELKNQNILNNKNLTAVEKEMKAREDALANMRGEGSFKRGMQFAGDEMRDRVQYMDYELGKNIPMKFADGLAQAMQATLNQTEDLGDALMGIASNFLQAIQSAFLQKAAYQIVGGVGSSTGLFSKGGGVRNYSRGGGVPAMVTNGEYVMSRDAVSKYGGAFMHSLNAGGKIPGYANGGAAPGSAIAENFGGGRGFTSGRAYQSKAMSSFFYTQSQNVGLKEDEQALMGVLQEEERQRQKAAAKKAKKRAFLQQLLGTALSAGLSQGISSLAESGALGENAMMQSWGSSSGIDSAKVTEVMNNNPGISKTQAMGLVQEFPHDFDYGNLNELPINLSYRGGRIRKYASGGHISGKSGIDQIPAMLSEGEYVIKASSARQLGKSTLDRINAGKFNDGGPVGSTQIDSSTSGGNTNNISISINMEKGQVSSEEKNQDSNPATSQEGGSEKDQAVLAEKIKQQVVSVIVEEQRPGGLLSE